MAKVHSGEESIAESFNSMSRVHERYRQTTDRRICDSNYPNVS